MARTILIVDDEPRSIALLRHVLQMARYSVIEAANGKQCIELAKSKKPDLILMDIMMPEMGGLEATRILKADITTSNIPILASTALAMHGDKEGILDAGCDGYISKPWDIEELLKQVTQYLSG